MTVPASCSHLIRLSLSATAILCVDNAAWARLAPAGQVGEGFGEMRNRQAIERAPGDASLAIQAVAPGHPGSGCAGPGRRTKAPTAKTASPASSNLAVQATDGEGAVGSVEQDGRRNVAVQLLAGPGGRQSIIQAGDGNLAVQAGPGVLPHARAGACRSTGPRAAAASTASEETSP